LEEEGVAVAPFVVATHHPNAVADRHIGAKA
jgi:hypothetical protein